MDWMQLFFNIGYFSVGFLTALVLTVGQATHRLQKSTRQLREATEFYERFERERKDQAQMMVKMIEDQLREDGFEPKEVKIHMRGNH